MISTDLRPGTRVCLDAREQTPIPATGPSAGRGTVTFMLGRCPDALPAGELGDHSYIAYLYIEGVDEFYVRAVAEAADVPKPPTDEPWGRREMAMRSPDGHRFMLGESI
jgi:uncharacterized glyoxalase superfamily protein PhnB